MSTGQILTSITIWISIGAYAAGAITFALSSTRQNRDAAARLLWTIACAALLSHVVFAFQTYHGWSHTAAYIDTARQTRDVVGLNWGSGLYVNYVLVFGWVADLTWWRLSGLDSYRRRPRLLVIAWHTFLFFIIFNSTVIFKSGVARWVGLLVCVGLCLAWWRIACEWSKRSGTV
jgi:hypothetical protein